MSKKRICFLAPGGGLGHTVRALSIAMELKKFDGVDPVILSSSPYSEGLSRLTGIQIRRIPLKAWSNLVIEIIQQINPELIVCDTFPFGINGELLSKPDLLGKSVYIARHLRFNNYFENKLIKERNRSPLTIIIEPLQYMHLNWIYSNNAEVVTTKYPVRFPSELFPTPIPQEVEEFFRSKPVNIVAHSGPKSELAELLKHTEVENCLLITPKRPLIKFYKWLEYFPARNLFPFANKIITGAGYNTMAECAAFKEKHIAVPFERNYDDQKERLLFDIPDGNSNSEVAELILSKMELYSDIKQGERPPTL